MMAIADIINLITWAAYIFATFDNDSKLENDVTDQLSFLRECIGASSNLILN